MRTAKERREALALVREGASYADAGRVTGICKETIRKWARQAGVPLKRTPIVFDPGQVVGSWLVIGEGLKGGKCKRWVCQCLKCEQICLVRGQDMKYGTSGQCAWCARRASGKKAREAWHFVARSPEWAVRRVAIRERQSQASLAMWARRRAEQAAKAG
jgi:hypothetical protein